eukprot:3413902-Pleurochrysis_carterae.AAC.1
MEDSPYALEMPGVEANPVLGSITCGVKHFSGLILAVAPSGRMSGFDAFASIFVAAQKVLICCERGTRTMSKPAEAGSQNNAELIKCGAWMTVMVECDGVTPRTLRTIA